MLWYVYMLYLTVKNELEYYLPHVNVYEFVICFLSCVIIIVIAERLFKKKNSVIFIIITAFYLTFIVSVTLLGRNSESKSSISTLFFTYHNAFVKGQINLTDIIFNTVLFFPVGLLISKYNKNVFCVLVLLLLPIIIEFTQLFTGRGVFEISDIINNFVGGLIGLLIARMTAKVFRFIKKKRKDRQVERTK